MTRETKGFLLGIIAVFLFFAPALSLMLDSIFGDFGMSSTAFEGEYLLGIIMFIVGIVLARKGTELLTNEEKDNTNEKQ